MAQKEYFPSIGKIKFEGKESKNPLAYRYYDAEKVIMGKKMKDWLKFAMAWGHTRRAFMLYKMVILWSCFASLPRWRCCFCSARS